MNSPRRWMALALLCYLAGVMIASGPALLHDPWSVVENDGRHFVAWLRSMADPALFRDDAIAAYFDSLTPGLYKALFAPAVWLGVDIGLWHFTVVKALTCGLTVLAARLFFGSWLSGWRLGFAMLFFCLLAAKWALAGLPRSFGFPIALLSLWAFAGGRLFWLALVMFAGALIYPSAVAVSGLAMGLSAFRLSPRPHIELSRRFWTAIAIAAAAAFAGLALFMGSVGESGATISLEEARAIEGFGPEGRTRFFRDTWSARIFSDGRGGMLPLSLPFAPGLAALATLFVLAAGGVFARRLGAGAALRAIVPLALAGLALFVAAYAIAFRAHLPNRYAFYGIGLAFRIAAAFGVVGLIDAAVRRFPARSGPAIAGAALLLAAGLFGFSLHTGKKAQIVDPAPALSAFLRAAPKDSVLAGFSAPIETASAFSGSRVHFALELLIPYKRDYYRTIRDRVTGLGEAMASTNVLRIAAYLAEHGVTHLLIDAEPDMLNAWKANVSDLDIDAIAAGQAALLDARPDCIAFRSEETTVIETACLSK